MDTTKKNVFVTGATRGIGRAIAEALLRDGYRVHICARNKEELHEAGTALSVLGEVVAHELDLTDRTAITRFALAWDEPLYGIVNNAGMWKEERIDEPDVDVWDATMNLNLTGLYFFTKRMFPHLGKPGRIVNISSQLGLWGRAGFGPYSASKHGVLGLTKSWAWDLSGTGITVNAVCPGWVGTQSNFSEIKEWAESEGESFEDRLKEMSDPLILKRFVTPEEVAHVVAFLVSEKASGITGKVHEVI